MPKRATEMTSKESWELFQGGRSVEEIAREGNVAPHVVVQHLVENISSGQPCDLRRFFTADEQAQMETAFATLGMERMGPVKESLGAAVSYVQLQICKAAVEARKRRST